MSDFGSVEIEGLDRLMRKMGYMENALQHQMGTPMKKAMYYLQGQVPGYPPPPEGSTYVRTGTLGRSISTKVELMGGQTVGKIGTNVVYAPYVIGHERQARVHRGRWYTLLEVVTKNMNGVVRIFADWIADMIARRQQ